MPSTKLLPPQTLVATESGLREIGRIEAGERVWSYDSKTGEWRLCFVEARHDNDYVGQMVTLDVGQGEIAATSHHPVRVVSGEGLAARPKCRDLAHDEDLGGKLEGRWVNSHDVKTGDVVFLKRHDRVEVRRTILRDERTQVCNLTVGELHNFAVGQCGFLVHNIHYQTLLNRRCCSFILTVRSSSGVVAGIRA